MHQILYMSYHTYEQFSIYNQTYSLYKLVQNIRKWTELSA